MSTLLPQMCCQFCGSSGFTGTLKTDQHQRVRRFANEFKTRSGLTHKAGQFFIDDFNNLLTGGQAFKYILSHSASTNIFYQFLYDFVVDIRLQKR